MYVSLPSTSTYIIYSQQSFMIITGRRMSGCCNFIKKIKKDELYGFVKKKKKNNNNNKSMLKTSVDT